MTDIVLFDLVRNPMEKSESLPLGLMALSSCLKKAGHSVKISSNFNDVSNDTLGVGIGCMTGSNINQCLSMAEKVREKYPDIPIIWGGAHPTLMPEQTLKHPLVDIVVKGQGEITTVELMNAIKNGKPLKGVKGILYKENNEIIVNEPRPEEDINKFPMLDYDFKEIKIENCDQTKTDVYDKLSDRFINYSSSRGCPHRCGFCSMHKLCRWSAYTPERVLEEVKILIEKFKIDGIYFPDDNFFVDKKRVERICDLFIKEKLDIKWCAECRCDYFVRYDDNFLKKLTKSGCVKLELGVESGSPRILKLMNKDITVEQAIKTAKRCKEFGIRTKLYFMMGFPTETLKDAYMTFRLIDKLVKIEPRAFYSITAFMPLPGTDLYELSLKMGMKEPRCLEDWTNLSYLGFDRPWGSKKIRELSDIMPCLTSILLKYQTTDRYDKLWQKIALLLIKRDAQYRWEHKFFDFPIEWKIVRKYLELKSKVTS